jgi:hypothetical protein
MMKENVGGLDKWARILIGALFVGLALIGAVSPWFYLAAIPMLSGIVGHCPMYSLVGISSCPLARSDV